MSQGIVLPVISSGSKKKPKSKGLSSKYSGKARKPAVKRNRIVYESGSEEDSEEDEIMYQEEVEENSSSEESFDDISDSQGESGGSSEEWTDSEKPSLSRSSSSRRQKPKKTLSEVSDAENMEENSGDECDKVQLAQYTVIELRDMLKRHDLLVSGPKAVLIDRLFEFRSAKRGPVDKIGPTNNKKRGRNAKLEVSSDDDARQEEEDENRSQGQPKNRRQLLAERWNKIIRNKKTAPAKRFKGNGTKIGESTKHSNAENADCDSVFHNSQMPEPTTPKKEEQEEGDDLDNLLDKLKRIESKENECILDSKDKKETVEVEEEEEETQITGILTASTQSKEAEEEQMSKDKMNDSVSGTPPVSKYANVEIDEEFLFTPVNVGGHQNGGSFTLADATQNLTTQNDCPIMFTQTLSLDAAKTTVRKSSVVSSNISAAKNVIKVKITPVAQRREVFAKLHPLNNCFGHIITIKERTTLGRGDGCTYVFQNRYVSTNHCEMRIDRGDLIIKDCSANGTYIKTSDTEDKIGRGQEVKLFDGDIVSLTPPKENEKPGKKKKSFPSLL